MTPAPRTGGPLRLVRASWAASTLSGLLLVGLGPVPKPVPPAGLVPATVTRYLSALLPPGARQVRVNNLYGSGHDGAWQFIAHLSWRDSTGRIAGGSTHLPLLTGADPIDTDFDRARLEREERIGWTLDEVEALVRRLPGATARLAMVELVPDPGYPAAVVACVTDDADAEARCEDRDRRGRLLRHYTDWLTDDPALGGWSVQRASSPVEPR